jgi:hypothetical protein
MKKILTLLSAVYLAADAANAQNLLLNGDFNSPFNAVNAAPIAGTWNPWSWGNGWANQVSSSGGFSSPDNSLFAVGGASGGGGGGFFQTVAATGGLTYELDVLSGADSWWLPTGTMTMFFLDGSGNTLATDTRNTVDPAVYGQNFDIAHPWASYTLDATAPDGTSQVKVEFAGNNATGSIWFENAVLTAQPVPEPGTAALVAVGSALLLGYRFRRK